jgi:hypothetical protein
VKQQFKKSLLALAITTMIATGAMAQNIGFEDGNSTGWGGNGISAVGTQTVQAGSNNWTINPYGSYMGKLTITSGSYSQMTSALNLTSSSVSGIQSTLSAQAQGGGNPTSAAWTSKTVTLTAGQTFTLAWQYVSTDYVPFNDGSIATLVKVGSPSTTAVLNNYTSQYALLGFTNPGTGDYSTGSYGATGWQTATYTVTESGDYLLGFGVFNLDDYALSPILYVDEVTGTTLQNGVTFGAVAPNPGTSAPDSSSGSVTPPPTTPTTPTLVSNVTGTTGSDMLAAGSITVNGGTIQIMMTGATLTQLFDVQAGGMTVDQNSNTVTMSGVVSGTGNVVVANSGTGGSITFTAVNTYTGSTTINTGATLINDGSISTSSSVTNNGTFTNNGQTSNVTNTATFTNNTTGTTGSVSNSGTVNNFGTISLVTSNSGTFNNFKVITGNVTNSNVFNNGTSSSSVGVSVGNVLNSGTFNNYATTGGVINTTTGLFTNNGTTGTVTNTGSFTNSGTTSDVTNANLFANSGTTGTVSNTGTFNQTGGTSTLINNAGTGTVNLSGGTTDIVNAGTVNQTGGTASTVTNNGTYTVSGGSIGNITNNNVLYANGPLTTTNYTQTSSGSTVLYWTNAGVQQLTVTGAASLAGNLQLNQQVGTEFRPSYGQHGILTAGTVTGKYDTLTLSPDNVSPLGYGLVYTGNSVSLKVTPSAAYTLAAVSTTTSNLANVLNLQAGSLGGTLNYDCNLFGENGLCVSTGVRTTSDSAGSIKGGNFIISKRINSNWRAGVFIDQALGNTTVGNVKLATNPAMGVFANWNEDVRGYGWGIQTSAAVSTGNLDISRTGSQYSEATTGKTTSNGQALQVKTTYAMPVTTRDTITPYAGLRYTSINNNGYTEQGAVYPISYGSTTQSTTDALAGISLSHNFGRTTASISTGVIQNLSYSAGTLTGTSGIYGAENINNKLPGSGYTSLSLGAGLSYDLAKNQYVGASLGWQQKSLLNTSILSVAVTYTVGF